jgi:hypothetical protein
MRIITPKAIVSRISIATSSFLLIGTVGGCKATQGQNGSEVLTISADANAYNEALFLGFPAGDAWIN